MAYANYYELIRKTQELNIDSDDLGMATAFGILDNAHRHLELYFSQYVKEFKNKENNRVFISLERAIEQELSDIEIPHLKEMYDFCAEKTTTVVRKVNFAYDALNFFLAYNQSKPEDNSFDDLFSFFGNQLQSLASHKTARRIRGMTKNSPEYHFGKPVMITVEYDFFIKGLRNSLVNMYGAPLQ